MSAATQGGDRTIPGTEGRALISHRKIGLAAGWVILAAVSGAGCGSDGGGTTPSAASPRLAFVSKRTYNDDVYLMREDGSDVVDLTKAAGNDEQPSWSPDGSLIAFVSDRTGHDEIFVMDTLGGHQVQVTNDAEAKGRPSWSPDGTKILYAASGALYTVGVAGTGVTPVTAPGTDQEPAWSPDGTRIAFSRGGRIWTSDPDGSHAVQVTVGGAGVEGEPAWSPDGTRLAFYRYAAPSDSYFVNVIRTDGTGEMSLTEALGASGVKSGIEPAWSPDGSLIAFTCDIPPVQDGQDFELCLVHTDGSHLVNLSQTIAPEHWPAWAP